MKTKKEIREEIRRKLKRQGHEERSIHSRRIHRSLYRLEVFKKSKCLLIYVSLPDEVETLPVIEKCLSMGKRVVVPRMVVKKKELTLREVKNLKKDFKRGPYGVLEPKVDLTRKVLPKEIDCIVLPGLAFDPEGNRLGRGRGFFDRLLSRIASTVPRIAFAFPFQVVNHLPTEHHDRPIDILLSS